MAASEACTRSGAFALLLAVVLFLLSMYWLQEKKDEAAGEYVADRVNLAMYIDTLDEDRVWQEYKRMHPDAERAPMSQLLHATVDVGPLAQADSGPQSIANQNIPAPPKPKSLLATPAKPAGLAMKPAATTHQAKPPAPSGLSGRVFLTTEIYEMVRIQTFLEALNNDELLTRSRDASNFFEFSIVRWAQKRNAIVYGNALTGICQPQALELPLKSRSVRYTPEFDHKALLDCLTLQNVHDLAKFELPTVTNPNSMGKRAAQDVDLSPGALPRDPYMATIVAQVLLFLVLTYFTAFTNEAISFSAFPAPGTVFGAFSRSSWTVAVFLFALWTPLISCVAVLVTSAKLLLAVGIVPIALVTLSAQRALAGTSFFQQLRPLRFFNRIKSLWHRSQPDESPTT